MDELPREMPSDRLVRRWGRALLYCMGIACLLGSTAAFMDRRAGLAAGGAAVALVWIVSARLIAPR